MSERVFISMTISPKKGEFSDTWYARIAERIRAELDEDPMFSCIFSKEKGTSSEFTHIQATLMILRSQYRKFRESIIKICRSLPGCDLGSGKGVANRTYCFKDRSDVPFMFGYPLKEYDDFSDPNLVCINVEGDLQELKDAVKTDLKVSKKRTLLHRLIAVFGAVAEHVVSGAIENFGEVPRRYTKSLTEFLKVALAYFIEKDCVEDYNLLRRNPDVVQFLYAELAAQWTESFGAKGLSVPIFE